MSKRRTNRLTPTCPPLTPNFFTTSAPTPAPAPNIHVEEMLWHLYRQAKIAADNFRRQRDDARAALRHYKAQGKIRHLARGFKPGPKVTAA